jgi:hypothetical protein
MREECEFVAARTQLGNTTKGDRGGSLNPPRRKMTGITRAQL